MSNRNKITELENEIKLLRSEISDIKNHVDNTEIFRNDLKDTISKVKDAFAFSLATDLILSDLNQKYKDDVRMQEIIVYLNNLKQQLIDLIK